MIYCSDTCSSPPWSRSSTSQHISSHHPPPPTTRVHQCRKRAASARYLMTATDHRLMGTAISGAITLTDLRSIRSWNAIHLRVFWKRHNTDQCILALCSAGLIDHVCIDFEYGCSVRGLDGGRVGGGGRSGTEDMLGSRACNISGLGDMRRQWQLVNKSRPTVNTRWDVWDQLWLANPPVAGKNIK